MAKKRKKVRYTTPKGKSKKIKPLKKKRRKRRNQKRKPITSIWQRRRRKIDGKYRMVWVRKIKGKIQVRRKLAHID